MMHKTAVLEVPSKEVNNHKILAQEESIFPNFLD
jgi:hypothetical protein